MPRATVPIVYARCGSDNGGGSDLEAQLPTYGPNRNYKGGCSSVSRLKRRKNEQPDTNKKYYCTVASCNKRYSFRSCLSRHKKNNHKECKRDTSTDSSADPSTRIDSSSSSPDTSNVSTPPTLPIPLPQDNYARQEPIIRFLPPTILDDSSPLMIPPPCLRFFNSDTENDWQIRLSQYNQHTPTTSIQHTPTTSIQHTPTTSIQHTPTSGLNLITPEEADTTFSDFWPSLLALSQYNQHTLTTNSMLNLMTQEEADTTFSGFWPSLGPSPIHTII